MVLAVGVPTAAYAALRTRRRSARAVAAAGFLLLLGSIVASGSRGALAGAFAGLLAFAVVAADGPRRKVLAAVAVTALLIVAAAITRLPKPHPGAPPLPSASPESNMPTKPVSPKRYVYPVPPPNLQDDIGRLSAYTLQTQVQERMINRVEAEQARLFEVLSELSHGLLGLKVRTNAVVMAGAAVALISTMGVLLANAPRFW